MSDTETDNMAADISAIERVARELCPDAVSVGVHFNRWTGIHANRVTFYISIIHNAKQRNFWCSERRHTTAESLIGEMREKLPAPAQR